MWGKGGQKDFAEFIRCFVYFITISNSQIIIKLI